jgi:hypothetical protein
MKMLILVGPQGSGNHLFAKIFSLHPDVHGWAEALTPEGYFVPHCKEPFNPYWNDVSLISNEVMGGKCYALTSISIPYIEQWRPRIPPVPEFVERLQSVGVETQVIVIGRDRTILTHQQVRLRGGPTWGVMPQLLQWLDPPPFYVSQELLYLYRRQYIRSLGHWLAFPTAWDDPRVDEILKEDANEKYIHPAGSWWLDEHVKASNTPPQLRK